MAAAQRQRQRYFGSGGSLTSDQLELNESDVWESINPSETRRYISNPRPLLRTPRKTVDVDRAGPRSLPVNIPDWSKILRSEYGARADDYDEEENERMPPHEYLARTRVASLSVHEGIGRTLKGRDLSRVRNAIWKKTGFED